MRHSISLMNQSFCKYSGPKRVGEVRSGWKHAVKR